MAEPLIRVDGLAVAYGGAPVIAGLSFAVQRSEFVCILGPSGCGKSTLLRHLGALAQPQGGRIHIGEQSPAQAWPRLGYVFQSPRLAWWRTALANVLLGWELRTGRRPGSAERSRAQELLAMVGLAKDGHKLPAMLSGGERQRVAIARALMVSPDVLLMDEPFSALDIATRQHLRAEVERIWTETGTTVLFVTHDVGEALVLGDRVLLLGDKPSRVVAEYAPGARPRDPAALAPLEAEITARLQQAKAEQTIPA